MSSDPILNSYEVTQPEGDGGKRLPITEEVATAFREALNVPSTGEALPPLGPQVIMGNPTDAINTPAAVPVGHGVRIEGGSLRAGGGESWRLKDLYYAARTDSPANGGSGTYLDPYDVSTPALFDQRMTELYVSGDAANLYFAAGHYYINPIRPHEVHPVVIGVYASWYWGNAWFLHGEGMGRTVFHFADNSNLAGDATGSRILLRSSRKPNDAGFAHVGCIRNITIDGGVTSANGLPGPALTYRFAFDLDVGVFSVENVELIRLGGRGQEMFPLILGYGIAAANPAAPPKQAITVTGCKTSQLYHDGGCCGLLINSQNPGHHQRCLTYNNTITDAYWTGVNFWHIDHDLETVDSGLSNYGCYNYDSGSCQYLSFTRLKCINGGSTQNLTGCITIGAKLTNAQLNPATTNWKHITIEDCYFQGREGSGIVCPGIVISGCGVDDLKIRNNRFKVVTAQPAYGIIFYDTLLEDTIYYPGYGIPAGYPNPHTIVPNGPIREYWGNTVVDDGSVPILLPNTAIGDATIAGVSVVNLSSRSTVLEGQTDNLDQRLTAQEHATANGHKGYTTRAALYADLTPADGTMAEVTNDPTPAYNGAYRKAGGAGTGSWQQSDNGIYADVAALKTVTAPISISTAPKLLPDGTILVLSFSDPAGHVGMGLSSTGIPYLPGLVIPPAGPASITSSMLVDGSVTTPKLADAGVTTIKIADANVTTVKLADSGVTTAKIADSNVTTAKIADSNVTAAKLADTAVSSAKLAAPVKRLTGNDLIPVVTDRARTGPPPTIGVKTTQSWQRLPDRLTASLVGVNSSGTTLEFRQSNGLLVRGNRRVGVYNPGAVGSTNYRGYLESGTTWPPVGAFAAGDYYQYVTFEDRIIGTDTVRRGDLMVYNGAAWVCQPHPGSGTTKYELDWWDASAAGSFDSIALAIGDRLVYLGLQGEGARAYLRWRRGRPDWQEYFRLGEFDPAAGLPATPANGDLWEASAAATAGGFPFAVGDTLIRTGGVWGRIPEGAVRSFANGTLVHLPCVQSAREWVVRRADKSLTQVGLSLFVDGSRKFRLPGENITAIGDSMTYFSFYMPGLNPGRTVTNRTMGGATSRNVVSAAEYLIANSDPDKSNVIISVHGQNNNNDLPQIQECAEAMARLCGTAGQRILHVSVMGSRDLVHNGTRFVIANYEEQLPAVVDASSNVYAKAFRYFRDSWPDQFIDFRKAVVDAVAGSPIANDASIQWPGMTNTQVAAAYGIPPFLWMNNVTNMAGVVPNSLNYVGLWTTAGLPTGGVANDYYLRNGPGASGRGNPIINVAGTWKEVAYDSIHLGVDGNTAMATAVTAVLTAKNW